jgi:DNA-directed RNA polymerase II subunit RPB2
MSSNNGVSFNVPADTGSAEIAEEQPASVNSYSSMESPASIPLNTDQGDRFRALSRSLIDRYYRTNEYPYTRHHIQSYNQFISHDLPSIIKSSNPILLLKDLIPGHPGKYNYKVEIFVGGQEGTNIRVGTPTISLQNTEEVRLLFPNECRLRNLTYATTVFADIYVKITYTQLITETARTSAGQETTTTRLEEQVSEQVIPDHPLFRIPVMLHSNICILNGKSKEFLRQAGECPQDHGGYFIVDGAEKVLITSQEQSFNTLYINFRKADPELLIYAPISCLSPETRLVKRVMFLFTRERPYKATSKDKVIGYEDAADNANSFRRQKNGGNTLCVSIPFVRKPLPVFVLFRALGIQSDQEIMSLIFPDMNGPEAQMLAPLLVPSIAEAAPFYNTHMAIQYIKSLTKGYGEAHVLDIIHNQLFIHIDDQPRARAMFLADCVRSILRVAAGIDPETDKDDIRNQRCLVSGFHIQLLFNQIYAQWRKQINKVVGTEYKMNSTIYQGANFRNLFSAERANQAFVGSFITDSLRAAFKGRWGAGIGEDKKGLLQSLSRLSYMDFMSHTRRVIMNFDTSIKITGPRHLHPSQFGYYCTNETPSGAPIGITKNLTVLAYISTATMPAYFTEWLRERMNLRMPVSISPSERIQLTPVYLNGGIVGYTASPQRLTRLLKLLKRTAWLPPTTSVSFNIRQKRVQIYLDEGRPVRPLIVLRSAQAASGVQRVPFERLAKLPTWRDLICGTHRADADLTTTDFEDPLKDMDMTTMKLEQRFETYEKLLESHVAPLEYVDPYEQNEAYIATFAEYIQPETTHMELHPSTILSVINSQIPFLNHNQSPRNQLGCSQSKQGLSMYATNWQNRYDNTGHILAYGEAPLCRTMYQDYFGEGRMSFGQNMVLAITSYTGYNQEDGLIINKDAVDRGLFRSLAYRSYEAYEEDDQESHTQTRFGNPTHVAAWMDLRPGLDYSKLDDRGIIRVGEYVDEMTVIVGAYMMSGKGSFKDASVAPQVWTRGRVESVVVTVNNMGLRMVKIRVCQDRKPEIGDKFCLSPDHEVLTSHGWKGIRHVTDNDFVCTYDPETKGTKFSTPEDYPMFDHPGGVMINVKLPDCTLQVTPNHRLYVREEGKTDYAFMEARTVQILMTGGVSYYTLSVDNREHLIQDMVDTVLDSKYSTVHCLTMPTGIFLVRRKGSVAAYWTGNSNRHGQKGTIGMLLRGHDMPRTESGLVPDMIMTPYGIVSRMTLGQIMEMICGKYGLKAGAVMDGTAFMNDGSPADAIGDRLEELGFERYGNEIMYNGATGHQIQTEIFMCPLYGMRLKHMTEDKWQARDKGRKEQRTHQPTGGRGNQGGLKIGEMDRDTILCHGIAGFVRESYMQRSDGAKFPICTGCGTIPIYNPKLGLEICTLCDGPVEFTGSNPSNIEIVPPLKKPSSEIVQVEMPYATKLLDQEMTSFLNMGLRFVTSAGVTKLKNPTNEFFSTEMPTGPQEPLRELVLPEIKVAQILPAAEPPKIEDLQAQAELAGMTLVPKGDALPEVAPETNPAVEPALEGTMEEAVPEGPVAMPEIVQGVPVEDGQELPAAAPGEAPVISIATDDAAMGADGLAATDSLIKSFSIPIESVSLPGAAATAGVPGAVAVAPPRRTLKPRGTSSLAESGIPTENVMGGGSGTRTIVVTKTG